MIHAIKSKTFKFGLGLEPNSENFQLLLDNILLNQVEDSAEAINAAASSIIGKAQLEISQKNCGDHRIRVPDSSGRSTLKEVDNESQRKTEISDLITLDKILESPQYCFNPNSTLIWIDTQGHEGHVLESAKKFIKNEAHNSFFVVEFWPYGLEKAGGAETFLKNIGNFTSIYNIEETESDYSIYPIDKTWLKAYYTKALENTKRDFYPHTNLLLVREEGYLR